MTLTFAPIRDKIERALRNDERLHLDADQVRALVRSPLWAMLAELTAKEFAELWQGKLDAPMHPEPALNSGHTGSTIAPNAKSGASLGTIPPHVHAAGEALASEEAGRLARQKRRRKP